MFQSFTKKIAPLFWAVCVMAIFSSSALAQVFQVTETFLKADEGRMTGPCPLRVVFNGYISANGPGVVEYTFARSDGAAGPVHRMEFLRAGTQTVTTDWTLGDLSVLPRYEGWQTIRILSPNALESSRATGGFVINCVTELKFGPAPKTTILDPPAAGHDSAQAYKQIAPALSASHKQKLERELSELKPFADKFQPELEIEKKTGLDADAMMAEFRGVAEERDPAKRAKRSADFNGKYEPQLLKSAQTAGVDLAAQRRELTQLLVLSDPPVEEGKTLVLAIDNEGPTPPSPPTSPPATADMTELTLHAPFSDSGTFGTDPTMADTNGYIRLQNWIAFAGSSQHLAYVTQRLEVEPGVSRVRVEARLVPSFEIAAVGYLGYGSAEAIVNLRVMQGGRVIASDRVSLGRVVAAGIGHQTRSGGRVHLLECEFTRTHPEDRTTYTLVAEVEGWAGGGGIGGGARVFISAQLSRFRVWLHRR